MPWLIVGFLTVRYGADCSYFIRHLTLPNNTLKSVRHGFEDNISHVMYLILSLNVRDVSTCNASEMCLRHSSRLRQLGPDLYLSLIHI